MHVRARTYVRSSIIDLDVARDLAREEKVVSPRMRPTKGWDGLTNVAQNTTLIAAHHQVGVGCFKLLSFRITNENSLSGTLLEIMMGPMCDLCVPLCGLLCVRV